MADDFDLIVLGGGSGGLAGAFRAAAHGARVALLEPSALGGTCVNVGCVPKKAMWLAAEVAGKLRQAQTLGFAVEAAPLDWSTFIAHRQRYIHNIHASYRRRLEESGIAVLPVRGTLIDAGRVRCSDGVVLQAANILIATGGHAFKPDMPGAELGGTSDDFFQWTQAPPRVAIVGGGYIAVELAGVLQALGSRVELFVRGPRLLEGFDTEITELLTEDYRQQGIVCHFSQPVTALHASGEQVEVGVGEARSGAFDAVLFATGRRANVDGLGLEPLGVALDEKRRIAVDARHATSVAGVHAVGDVTDNPALTPVAIAAARRLMDRLYGARRGNLLDLNSLPTVAFSHPPLAQVGLTEAAAREQHGEAVHVYRTSFRPMLHALADSPQRSLFKLVCVGEHRHVVGLHLLGEAADEMLQGFAVAIRRGITLEDLQDTIAIHPTSAEEVVLLR